MSPAKESARFLNRELCWLEFDRRVLSLATYSGTPLLERLRFLCLSATTLDEFFMVRVAGLRRLTQRGVQDIDSSGMSVSEQLQSICLRVNEIVARQYACLQDQIIPALREAGIDLKWPEACSTEERAELSRRAHETILPALTPVRIDSDRPLPLSGNRRQYVLFRLRPLHSSPNERAREATDTATQGATKNRLALVPVPPNLERLIILPDGSGGITVVPLEHVVSEFGADLFSGHAVEQSSIIQITRDADMGVDEEHDEGFIDAMRAIVEERAYSDTVRLVVSDIDSDLVQAVRQRLQIDQRAIFQHPRPIDLGALMQLADLEGYEALRWKRWLPQWRPEIDRSEDIWEQIGRQDILFHHPYDSFEPIVHLLQSAAVDADVLAIKMTLYRTSGDSPVVRALEKAAAHGKQVTVLVELKARFDERRNIDWAVRLERVGVIVIHGVVGLKVHAKALLIVRRGEQGIEHYTHISSGNYNDRTAQRYSDISLLTADADIAYDIGQFFNMITGYSALSKLQHIIVAPLELKRHLLQMIERERARAESGEPGLIMAKLNTLCDDDISAALYRASQSGVTIRLIVRGICTLRPAVAGLSENISVISIVGRFLEHSRIYFFRNGGSDEVYGGSADWMPRNMERRVELMFPVISARPKRQLLDIFRICCADNQNSFELQPDGSYIRRRPAEGEEIVDCQAYFRAQASRTTSKISGGFRVRRHK